MGTGPPLRQEGGPDVSPGPGPASEPLPSGEGGPWAHVLFTPLASFPAGELPQRPEWPEMLGCADPGREASGDIGGTSCSRTGGLLRSTGCAVPDK